MKNRLGFLLCIPLIMGILCMICNLFLQTEDVLAGYTLENLSITFIGLFISLCGVVYGVCKEGQKDFRFLIAGLLIRCLLLLIGGQHLISVGLDEARGTTTEHLINCSVRHTASLKRLFSPYHLEGMKESGEDIKLRIDKQTFYDYKDEYGFQASVSYWEHSGVFKEIMQE